MKLFTPSIGVLFAITSGFCMAQTLAPVLDLKTARLMADACERLATEKGWKMVIAVHDQGGLLKYFSRMDGSFLISVDAARDKSGTSARLPFGTRELGEMALKTPGIELIPGVSVLSGGLPVFTASGVQLGGIGVSGGTALDDEACAQAGLDAVKDLLAH